MKAYSTFYIVICFWLGFSALLQAQNLVNNQTQLDHEAYKSKVVDLIDFLEYSVNAIGDPETPARDKNVLITQSYLKAFKDSKVQIEDDLNENRDMVTHKDVQAYLSDIDFFFKTVRFEFIVDDVTFMPNTEGQSYYLVTMTRNLQGITIENDSINSNMIRYVEVNLNEAARDIKIASIYTTRLSESEELSGWWSTLPYPWSDIFKNQLGLEGDITSDQLREVASLKKLDLSAYPRLSNLEPVSRLSELKRIDISGTQVTDIVPLRNLTELEYLDISNTRVSSLDPLKYALKLRVLRMDSTRISNIDLLSNFAQLQQMSASHSFLSDLKPLTDLQKLEVLDVAKTRIKSLSGIESANLNYLNASDNNFKDLSPLTNQRNLRHLKIDNSLVTTLAPLKDLQQLKVLSCNNTLITTLEPISKLSALERIYCDNTLMVSSEAKRFITDHPGTLVVYGTESLRGWWNQLDPTWQSVLSKAAGMRSQRLSKEQMAQIANITRIDVSGLGGIVSLEPIRILKNLKELNIEATGITDLRPLRGLLELEHLEASNTGVSELYSLEQLPKLRLLGLDNSKVKTQEINRFIINHPNCLVMYKTVQLLRWWGSMSNEWRSILKDQLDHSNMSDKERLHSYVNIEKLIFRKPVSTLEPLKEFIKLRELGFTGTSVSSLEPLKYKTTLEVLRCSQSPIEDLSPLSNLKRLKKLNFEDTLVEDLEPLESIKGLSELRFSGTKVKDLKSLSDMPALRIIECYNTDVKNLKPIESLKGLKSLKCYNTKIKKGTVDSFKKQVPQCEVVHY